MRHVHILSRQNTLPQKAANIALKEQQVQLLGNLVGVLGNIADISIETSSYIKTDDNAE